MSPGHKKLLIVPGLLLVVIFVLNISMGSVSIPISATVRILLGQAIDPGWNDIIWHFRIPKAITCVLAGSALASGGLMMQSWFRNPLAGPDVLGLSSGASLLVALVILTGISGPPFLRFISVNPWSVSIAASIGSMLVFLLVLALAQKVRNNASLLIIGLMLSAATASFVSVLQFLSPADDLQSFLIWTMGTVGSTGWAELLVMTVLISTGTAIAIASVKPLNTLLLGENYARTMGINVKRSRFWIVLSTSLLTGTVTAFCGPIAFVGLAVPQAIRQWFSSSDHRILLPAVMMAGAALLLFCDMISQFPGTTQILPLNAMTSLIGAPVVIWIVMRSKNIQS